jgi:hypothetical protein
MNQPVVAIHFINEHNVLNSFPKENSCFLYFRLNEKLILQHSERVICCK